MPTAPRIIGDGRRALLLAALLALSLPACQSTRFPEDPAAHPLWEELQEAPDEYYFLVRTGVRSRVLGLQPEARMHALLRRVRAQWAAIDRQETPEALVDYLYANELAPLARRVEATLEANAGSLPPSGAEPRLAAGALKVGLLEAHQEAQQAQ